MCCWRVAAYKRAGSGPGKIRTELRPAALPNQLIPPTNDAGVIEAHRASLTATERAFSDRAQVIGLGPAFVEFGSEDAMNMGSDADFLFSNRAIGGGMPPDPKSPVAWAPDQGTLVAAGGDLGVTWGYIRPHAPPPPGRPSTIPFFTVWPGKAQGRRLHRRIAHSFRRLAPSRPLFAGPFLPCVDPFNVSKLTDGIGALGSVAGRCLARRGRSALEHRISCRSPDGPQEPRSGSRAARCQRLRLGDWGRGVMDGLENLRVVLAGLPREKDGPSVHRSGSA